MLKSHDGSSSFFFCSIFQYYHHKNAFYFYIYIAAGTRPPVLLIKPKNLWKQGANLNRWLYIHIRERVCEREIEKDCLYKHEGGKSTRGKSPTHEIGFNITSQTLPINLLEHDVQILFISSVLRICNQAMSCRWRKDFSCLPTSYEPCIFLFCSWRFQKAYVQHPARRARTSRRRSLVLILKLLSDYNIKILLRALACIYESRSLSPSLQALACMHWMVDLFYCRDAQLLRDLKISKIFSNFGFWPVFLEGVPTYSMLFF
jgi:hypothetical protein